MDLPRPGFAQRKRRRRVLYSVIGLAGLILVTAALSRLQPAAPLVEAPVWLDTVKRGEMVRQVRGPGTLVPEEIRWIASRVAGRVENIRVLPGTEVQAEMILIELSNPELEQAAFDAEWALKAAQAQLARLKVQLESDRLGQEAAAATLKAEYSQAKLEAEADAVLAAEGLVAMLTAKRSRSRADELATRFDIETRRLKIGAQAAQAQLDEQMANLEKLSAQLELKRRQVESLKVRAGIDGVVQSLGDTVQLQVGQEIGPGATLARVANSSRLKAELRIPETQVADVLLGHHALIDTRNGVVPGRVRRIDPASQGGSVRVDVALEGPLPKGARPDLSVDGTIEIERLENVLYVGRPVHGAADSTVGLFKIVEDGNAAVRVSVKFGRSSVSTIEVAEGLAEGDQVVLSDMSNWDSVDRVRFD